MGYSKASYVKNLERLAQELAVALPAAHVLGVCQEHMNLMRDIAIVIVKVNGKEANVAS